MSLSKLPNIGKELEKLLNAIGISTIDALHEIGSVEAACRLNIKGEACINKLYAIEGAIQNIRWHQLSKEYRNDLKTRYLEMT